MAASSGDDIPAQLSALLGHSVKRIRITNEVPPRISVIDLASAITMKDANQAAEQVAYVKKRHPEVTDIFGDFKFRGRGECGASTPSPSVFEGNHGGTKPSFFDGKDCSSCRHALLFLLENGIVVLYFKRKLPV